MTHWDDDQTGLDVPECDDARRLRGGPQADDDAAPAPTGKSDEDAKRAALAAKKADVRKRLEEAGKKGKKKKGFLTPERKKKLRKLLMIKAAENLKNQQKTMDTERQSVLSKRVPACPNIDGVEDTAQLAKIYNDLFAQMLKLEEEKYDINFVVSQKDAEISEITISVNDLRGKFVKPTLKKVSKYDNKFRKQMAAEGDNSAKPKEDFRAKLKTVEKKNVMEVLESKQKSKADKPEWTKKADKDGAGARRASQASSKGGEPPASPRKMAPEPAPEEEEEEPEAGEVEEEEEEEE